VNGRDEVAPTREIPWTRVLLLSAGGLAGLAGLDTQPVSSRHQLILQGETAS